MNNLERIKKILKEYKEEIREKYGVVIARLVNNFVPGLKIFY